MAEEEEEVAVVRRACVCVRVRVCGGVVGWWGGA